MVAAPAGGLLYSLLHLGGFPGDLQFYSRHAKQCVLELGAGDGHLSHHLAISLSGYAKLICSDTKPPKDAIGWAALSCEIRAMDSEKVTELLQPTIAIISWQPSGIDWTLHCRAVERCREYILLGESDSSTCGDGWATWGIVPDRYLPSHGPTTPNRIQQTVHHLCETFFVGN